MISIDRNILLDNLFDFSQLGSGLVVGKPGVGKSYILSSLKHKYLENDVLSVLIKIDNLFDASDNAIENELKLNGNWIETLKKIKIHDKKKALMIFDAFDAARNEIFRNEILKQIKKAKEELSSKWNIIVSVRTYDASKSQQLIKLFPQSEDYADNIQCRKREIPALTEQEILKAILGNKTLLDFYNESTKSLKEILSIPFFLDLSDKILQSVDKDEITDIKKFRSETQLLKIFWDKKIINTSEHVVKEKILFNLTTHLIEAKSMSWSKQAFFINFENNDIQAFEYLRSENIIDEVSVGRNRIAYSHNILFDYAVSNLCITADANEILRFIKEDSSRPFFLRPSFQYFFTQLWYEQREDFWYIFWTLWSNQEKEVQLFVRLVLTGVISSEFSTVDDLKPITERGDALSRNTVIRNLLQSIRFLKKKTTKKDIHLFYFLSKELNEQFLWEFAFLLDRAVKDSKTSYAHLHVLGTSARNLLKFVLVNRQTDLKPVLDRIGATRGVELVCKTYSTDIVESKSTLRSILNLLNEQNFEIQYFTNLSEYISEILPYDANFVAEVYLKLFGHTEDSDAQTSMGASVIMSFVSNRKQDFEMCHYRLIEFYPLFLSHSQELAIPTGLKILNDYVLKDRSRFHRSAKRQKFNFKGFECEFINDLSSIWSDNIVYHRPAYIGEHLNNFFTKRIQEEELDKLRDNFNSYISNAKVGYTWKKLLEIGQKAVVFLPDYFIDFCIEKTFLTNSDTSYEVAQLIEVGSNYFSKNQIMLIEQTLFDLFKHEDEADRNYYLKKYLSRIPQEKLNLNESRDFIRISGQTENKKNFESTSSYTPYTTEMWLEEQGVDTSEPTISSLLNESQELTQFNHTWLNGTPDREAYLSYLKKGETLFNKLMHAISESISSKVIFSVLSEISQTFTIISRNIDSLQEEEFDLVKTVIHYCFQYISDIDKSLDESTSASSGYSPTPRIVASESLSLIASKDDNEVSTKLLISGIKSSNAVVRLNSSKYLKIIAKKDPELYWKLILERLATENDALVASVVLANIVIYPYNEDIVNKVLKTSYSNEKLFKWNNSFIKNFVLLAIQLHTRYKNTLADHILTNAYEREEFCRSVIFEAFDEFRISSLRIHDNSEYFIDSTLKWTMTYLDKIEYDLKNHTVTDLNTDPVAKRSLNLLDLIIQRSYFVLENTGRFNKLSFEIPEENHEYLYFKIKPLFVKIISLSYFLTDSGLIIGHTAHYFIQTLNGLITYDAKDILSMVTRITKLSLHTGYTFDSLAIREVVSLTEKLLADYRQLLTEEDSFQDLIDLLEIYMQSGWVEALELLWKLDEIFK